jgi:hypothetical protein
MRYALSCFAALLCAACGGGGGQLSELEDDAGGDASAPHDAGDALQDAAEPDSGALPVGEQLASPAARAQIASYRCPEDFDACGGDPVGLWAIRPMYCHSNIDEAAYDGFPLCRETITRYGFEGSGTIELTEDGMGEVALVFESDHHMRLDRACLEREAGGDDEAACLAYEESLNRAIGREATFCEWAGNEVCECDFRLVTHLDATAPYTISGTSIDDDVALSPFCVEGDVMRINLMSNDGVTYTGAVFDRVIEAD